MTIPPSPASHPFQHHTSTGGVAPGQAHRADAGGTIWRLRSLVAMGHDATRIGRALGISPRTARRIIRGDVTSVTLTLRQRTAGLWDAWWDKRPPEHTPAQRRAATTARHTARQHNWCQPLALDEDCLDDPGYRPYATWRPATGTGVAPDFGPATQPTREVA